MIIPSLVCIAVAVYFEARGELGAGQIAVAHVIQNRVEDPEGLTKFRLDGYKYSKNDSTPEKPVFLRKQ